MATYTIVVRSHPPLTYQDGSVHVARVSVEERASGLLNSGRGFSTLAAAELWADGVATGIRAMAHDYGIAELTEVEVVSRP